LAINNSLPFTLPLNYASDGNGNFTEPYDTIYFRAYNSCSNGATSSYSNIISASCTEPPAPEFSPLTIEFRNLSFQNVKYTLNNDSPITVSNNSTSIFTVSESEFNIDFSILGSNAYPGFADDNGYRAYNIRVSGSNVLLGNIITSVVPQIDTGNYPFTLISSYTPAQDVIFVTDGDTISNDVSVSIDRTNYTPSATIKLLISTI
jgi:hypothetical protein